MTGRGLPVADRLGTILPLEPGIDHIRGPGDGPVILEYGDYECPGSREAFREIERLEVMLAGHVRFAFRHLPMGGAHPHAAGTAAAAEAAAGQGKFWEMHSLLFDNQDALSEEDLRSFARHLDLRLDRFAEDCTSDWVVQRLIRDIHCATASGVVSGTPMLFVDGAVHRGANDAEALREVVERSGR